MVSDPQQRIGVRREVDPDDVRLLVDHEIDEAGILVAETVVILPPDVGGEQIVQRGDRAAPRQAARNLQPFRMLVEHGIDDVDEGLVAREQSMAPGQEIALEPALAEMFAQHLHHPAVARQMDIVGFDGFHPDAIGRLEHCIEPV